MKRLLSPWVFLIACAPAFASDPLDEASIRQTCSDAGSQAAMRQCLEKKASDSATALELAERNMRAAIEKWDEDKRYVDQAVDRFNASSKAFVQFRQVQCDFFRALAGGAAGNTNAITQLVCLTELNGRRARQLNQIAERMPQK